MNNQIYLYYSHHLKIPGVLGALCPELGPRPNVLFLIINHSIPEGNSSVEKENMKVEIRFAEE